MTITRIEHSSPVDHDEVDRTLANTAAVPDDGIAVDTPGSITPSGVAVTGEMESLSDRGDRVGYTVDLEAAPQIGISDGFGDGEDRGSDQGPLGEFLEQFDSAEAGEFVAYHIGDLATDSQVGETIREVRACQVVAMGLFQDREAHLVQRRFGPHRYVYYAVKR